MSLSALKGIFLVGVLSLGQEVDRLVDLLRYEEAGLIVEGRLVVCEIVQALDGGGIALTLCRHTTRLDGTLGASE